MAFGRAFTRRSLVLAAASWGAGGVLAQALSSRPIRFVVPFAAGGGSDVMARVIAEPLAQALGHPVVVDNKPGGNATIGADFVAKSAPDGMTLLHTSPGPQITNPFLMGKLPYDPVKDLLPVARLGVFINALVVNPKLPVRNVNEFIAYAKAHPGKLSFASPGIGSGGHLAGEYLKSVAQIDTVHVPYKGTGAALQDLVAGNVDWSLDTVAAFLPMIRSGQLRAIAVGYQQRSPSLPDVPTLAETFPGFDASPMNYLSVRGGTPKDIVDRLNKEVNSVLGQPQTKQKLLELGVLVSQSTPEEIARQVDSERAKWKAIIEASGAHMK
ncbi:MAG: tripartite tricarboxylate transporter substrate binding protein [Ottowia sp.]|uniref:Bug family tripartite tricarboxylate transporter substrate binding protein n=1 Tax=unclassified Ottowia TaxID=2645081 RepID=UPI003C2AEA6C